MLQAAHTHICTQTHTHADKLGQIWADKRQQTLTALMQFHKGGVQAPETGWGVPKKKRQERGRK